MESTLPNNLKSSNTLTIAHELSEQQFKIIRENNDLGGAIIADRLESLRNAIWGDARSKTPAPEHKQKQIFDSAIDGLDNTQKEQLISSYARMGHLYEIASLSARSNYLKSVKNSPDKTIPGGVAELISDISKIGSHTPVEDIVERLNQPVFEVVMTAHPTNVNSLDSMKAQREINKALENGDQKALTQALTLYQKTPLLHQITGKDGSKTDGNLAVHDETQNSLYFLGNIYEDLPKTYQNYDAAISKKYGGEKYDPKTLNLKMKFGSWGSSGDKDGNKNVTAETTLEAIALHTQAILTRYSKELGEINSPELTPWKKKFDVALTKLEKLTPRLKELSEDAAKIRKSEQKPTQNDLDSRFHTFSENLAAIRNELDPNKKFEEALEKNAKEKPEVLNLLRRFRTFGFNFAKIEYRETAKEYDSVVGEVIGNVDINGESKPFKNLTPQQKVDTLTKILLEDGNKPAILFNEKKSTIKESADKKYDDEKDITPIAYHTFKRMALARDFGDIIRDNVLAECGQIKNNTNEEETTAQGVANILEAQFLQRAVEKNGKRAVMGIIPLFEEPDTMKCIDKIMGAAYENKAYEKQLNLVMSEKNVGNLTQQVMIAHSDNARRSGLQAARAYIHEAHHKMQALHEQRKNEGKNNIQIQFFEGGSISDAYRNGVRAISASVNAFNLHNFAKFTFQGGDLLNYFNHPDSTARLIDRQISHQAKSLQKDENGKWVPTKNRQENGHTPNPAIDEVAVQALKDTLSDYKKHDFTPNAIGILLAALDYNKVKRDSNGSSRADDRTKTFAAGSTSSVGAAGTAVNNVIPLFKPVDIEGVRTISFSKAFQGSGVVPSWIGSLELKDKLISGIKANLATPENPIIVESKVNGKVESKLPAKYTHEIYNRSPTFRDAQDRSAFALALTDMDTATELAKRKLNYAGQYKDDGLTYLERIQKTYNSAAELAYSSLTGKELHSSNFTNNRQIRDKMLEALPLLKDDIINKTNYRAALLHWQIKNPEMFESLHMGRTAHLAKDTVEHGRWLGASDPTQAIERSQIKRAI